MPLDTFGAGMCSASERRQRRHWLNRRRMRGDTEKFAMSAATKSEMAARDQQGVLVPMRPYIDFRRSSCGFCRPRPSHDRQVQGGCTPRFHD
jgi:hypothetical protein